MSTVAALMLALLGTDRFGDRIAPGVQVRYGTARLCAGSEKVFKLALHPTSEEVYATAAAHDGYNGGVPPRTLGWNLRTGQPVFAGEKGFQQLHFDPTGRYQLEQKPRGIVRVWDTQAKQEIGQTQFDRAADVVPIGFHDGQIIGAEWFGPMGGGVSQIRAFSIRGQTETWRIPVELGQDVVQSRTGEILTLAGRSFFRPEEQREELCAYSASTGQLTGWRRLKPDADDFDPGLTKKFSSTGQRFFLLQKRTDEKADRYRGYPECRITVFHSTTQQREAVYDFRLDHIGQDRRLPRDETGDGGHHFHNFTLSDDGQFLAWADHDDCLRIRHLPTGRIVTAFGRSHRAAPMAFSPHRPMLIVLDDNNILRRVDPFTGRFFPSPDAPSTASTTAAVSPDGQLVATGHECGEVWVWEANTGKPIWHAEPDGVWLREVHFNSTGNTLSAVGFGARAGVRTWDAKTGRELGTKLSYRYPRTTTVSADGKHIQDLIEEKGVMEKGRWAYPLFVRTRELATGKELKRVRLDHHLGLGNEMDAVSSGGGRVVLVKHNSTPSEAIAYDATTGKRLCELKTNADSLALSWDGRIAVVTRHPNETKTEFHIWDTTEAKKLATLPFDGKAQGLVVVSHCRRYLLTSNPLGSTSMLGDCVSRKFFCELPHHADTFFPDGRTVLCRAHLRGAERISLEPLAWKLVPPPKPNSARLQQLWQQLGEPNALPAVFELARHPAEAVPFLKSKLLVPAPDAKLVAAQIERLGSKLFLEREAASQALREFGATVLPKLNAEWKAAQVPEVRTRLQKLIAFHSDSTSPQNLARLRAVEVLEHCRTVESQAILKTLVESAPGTPWGEDAKRVLQRSVR